MSMSLQTEPKRAEKAEAYEATASRVGLLTAGRDKPYALGLAEALIEERIPFDFIGSDVVDGPSLHGNRWVRFLRFRDQAPNAGFVEKMRRVASYYWRLMRYAATTPAVVLHILWNNKFEWFDRTLLMLYYRLLGKKLVLTVHNVNAGKRDGVDSFLNRLTLRCQYSLSHHLFVHTEVMKSELVKDFGVPRSKVSVIPFGINNTLPNTSLTRGGARARLGIGEGEKTLLFFGNIAPYKGLEFLVEALHQMARDGEKIRLIIAGRPKGCEPYWAGIRDKIRAAGLKEAVVEKIEYIPDEAVEVFFKAADAVVLPYTHIFQSGVLFLGYSFGLPVIATDVGALREDIVEGRTGFVCRALDAADLARAIRAYFGGDLYCNLAAKGREIQEFANEKYSWAKVGEQTKAVYQMLWRDGNVK